MIPVTHARHDDSLEILHDVLERLTQSRRRRGQRTGDVAGAHGRRDRPRLEVSPVLGDPVDQGVALLAEFVAVHWGLKKTDRLRLCEGGPVGWPSAASYGLGRRPAYFSSLKAAWRLSIGSYFRSSIRSGCFLGFLVVTYM